MANQKQPDSRNHDRHSDGDFGGKHWTDGFPHSFHGWGPQTPTPDNELSEADSHVKLGVPDDLTWQGGNDEDHIIWRYEGTRH